MHFVREVIKHNDPRCSNYYIYSCSVCGHEEYYKFQNNFDTIRMRKCFKCGVIDDSNNEEYLIQTQSRLEQEIKETQEKLKTLQLNLSEVVEKIKCIKEIEVPQNV